VLRRRGYTGRGVTLGHLDTGIDSSHPALGHQPTRFQYFDREGLFSERPPSDLDGHGTANASIICGIAPECSLHSAAVIEEGNVVARILSGLQWMLESHVRVLWIPCGIPGYSPVFRGLVHMLARNNTLIVAAIGNLGAGRSLSPGDYPEVLSVGAMAADGNVAPFSGSSHLGAQTTCRKPDLLAPGDGALVAALGGGYHTFRGTSAACAYVAGVAALLAQAAPAASASILKAALIAASQPLPESQRHRSRRGVIQPFSALQYLLNGNPAEEADEEDFHTRSKFTDPRLRQMFSLATPESVLDAVCVVERTNRDESADPRGPAGSVVDLVSRALGERPKRLYYIASAGIVVILARAPFIARLAYQPNVLVASAADIDRCWQ
jgi:hypothetical protein